MDAKLISSVPNISYLTGLNYFSDTEREVFIILTKNKKFLITDRRYSEEARKKTNGFTIIESGALNYISNEIKSLIKNEKIKTLGIEENNLTVLEYKKVKKHVKTAPLNLKGFRSIKNNKEIINIKHACKITDQAFEYILTKLKEGISEKEVVNQLILFFRNNNAEYSFKPIVAFGKNSSAPHHEPTSKKLVRNQIILLDFGAKVNYYCSDMTRTVFFGKPDKKFKDIYESVLLAHENAINKIKPGVKASLIDKAARKIVSKKYGDITHAVGHGVGLEVHEKPTISPKSKDIIKNNMVFTIEPGIYVPNYGGVRIEDIVLVRDGKTELISKAKRGLIELNA